MIDWEMDKVVGKLNQFGCDWSGARYRGNRRVLVEIQQRQGAVDHAVVVFDPGGRHRIPQLCGTQLRGDQPEYLFATDPQSVQSWWYRSSLILRYDTYLAQPEALSDATPNWKLAGFGCLTLRRRWWGLEATGGRFHLDSQAAGEYTGFQSFHLEDALAYVGLDRRPSAANFDKLRALHGFSKLTIPPMH